MPRLPSCENCLIRNILLGDHFKNEIVSQRAFKDKSADGLSMTETRDVIIGQEDFEDYLNWASGKALFKLGAALFTVEDAESINLQWSKNPQGGKFGDLHVLGPKPEEMTKELRMLCAEFANQTGWSKGPTTK